MMSDSLLVQVLLEYLLSTYDRYSYDVVTIRENIRLLGLDSYRLHDLIVAEARLDAFAVQSRKIREIIKLYSR